MEAVRQYPKTYSKTNGEYRLEVLDHGTGSECNRSCACRGRGGRVTVLTALKGLLVTSHALAALLEVP